MGAAVSSWRLARSVSSTGQLGVVSGVGLDGVLARRLQDGDLAGDIRRALANFPFPAAAQRILDRYFLPGGRPPGKPYRSVPMPGAQPNRTRDELTVLGNFVEVFLARETHSFPVGINYLEKIQIPHLPAIYGAMLAGVACVLMGAGIATRIPGALQALASHSAASYELSVTGGDPEPIHFDPSFFGEPPPPLMRPKFIPIVSSHVIAATMLKRSNGPVDGFVVETWEAGGHNAPARAKGALDALGQPLYGEKDRADLAKLRELGLPFWLAGRYATPEKLREALDEGAAGVQIGTAFALCEESGLDPELRAQLLASACSGTASVRTDPLASPTGFPFKVAQLPGTLSDPAVYEGRERICDLGFLREAYRTEDGKVGYRCPAEPVDQWIAKGGAPEAAAGRKCLCNALMANVGLPQTRPNGFVELPLLTAGDDLVSIARFLPPGKSTYTAQDVLAVMLG